MNKRTERLAALALFLLCAAIVWSQLDAHVRAQTSIPGPGSATISVTSSNGALETTQTLVHGRLGTFNTNLGATNETASTTDTATSGLNGRLQRIAQRLTSLIALIPSGLSSNAVGTPLYTSAPWCPVAATSSTSALSAATDNQSISTGCTGACQKSVCKNLSQTDILCVRPTSGGNRTCLLPGDAVEFTGNTSCFFDNSAAPAVSGTQYVTAVGCDP